MADDWQPAGAWQQWETASAILAASQPPAYRTEILRLRSGEPPAHEIKAVRMARGSEKAWCSCGAVLPLSRDGDASLPDAMASAMRQHLESEQP